MGVHKSQEARDTKKKNEKRDECYCLLELLTHYYKDWKGKYIEENVQRLCTITA
jgi:hypothetical protein